LAHNYLDYNSPYDKMYFHSYMNLTEVEKIKINIPDKLFLYQNYPNPFNSSTRIKYMIPSVGISLMKSLQLKIYDILGREVATLADGIQKPGEHTVSFEASGLSSGVYFYRLKTGSFVTQKSMLLIK
jgi:hypothetical protein